MYVREYGERALREANRSWRDDVFAALGLPVGVADTLDLLETTLDKYTLFEHQFQASFPRLLVIKGWHMGLLTTEEYQDLKGDLRLANRWK